MVRNSEEATDNNITAVLSAPSRRVVVTRAFSEVKSPNLAGGSEKKRLYIPWRYGKRM